MNELQHFTTRLPSDMKVTLKVKAAEKRTSVQELVIEAISEWIEKEEEKLK